MISESPIRIELMSFMTPLWPRQVSLLYSNNQQSVSDSTLEFALFMLHLHHRVEAVMKAEDDAHWEKKRLRKRPLVARFIP